MIYTLGIDPGNKGALALVDQYATLIKAWRMPTTGGTFCHIGIAELLTKLESYITKTNSDKLIVGIEKTFAHSKLDDGKSKVALHNYGIGFGVLLGVVATLKLEHHLFNPRTWQKEMWIGVDMKKKPKEKSLQAFLRIFPDQKHILIPDGCKKIHDGIVDAGLIAEYTRRVVC